MSDDEDSHDSHQSEKSPLYDRSTGIPMTFPKPKSALEEEEREGMEVFEELGRNNQVYQDILNLPKQGEEDETYELLNSINSIKKFEPKPIRAIRPKPEPIAADERLMNKLKMELRSAKRGLYYIERRLNGVGSSDEGEWVDDEDDPTGEHAKRLRAEEALKLQRLAVERPSRVATPQPPPPPPAPPVVEIPVVVAAEPSRVEPSRVEPSRAVKLATTTLQVCAVWLILEIYFLFVAPLTSPFQFDS